MPGKPGRSRGRQRPPPYVSFEAVFLETPFQFEPFGDHHRRLRDFFSCGEKDLDEYLKTRARKEMDHRIAVVYVLYDAAEERVAGYYTLSSLIVERVELPEDMKRGVA